MAEIDLSSISALPIEERIKLAEAIWSTIPEQAPPSQRNSIRSWSVPSLDVAAWRSFFDDALIRLHASDDQLPAEAQRFLQTFGLPKMVRFHGGEPFTMSFEPLADPIVGYNSLIGWGIFFDSELDARMSEQLVIGHVDSAAGVASLAIERTTGAVHLVNIAALPPQTVVNSSVVQFAQSLQAAIAWSQEREEFNAVPTDFVTQLKDRLQAIDRAAFAAADNYWPSVIGTMGQRAGTWRVLSETPS